MNKTARDIAYLAYWGAVSDKSEFDDPKEYMDHLETLIEEYYQTRLESLAGKVEERISKIQLVLNKGQSKHAFTSPQLESRIDELKEVLTLITQTETGK